MGPGPPESTYAVLGLIDEQPGSGYELAALAERSDVLPPGAGVRALAGAASFEGGGVALGVVVLVAWIAVSAVVILALDRRAHRRTSTVAPAA